MSKLIGKSIFEEAQMLKSFRTNPNSVNINVIGDQIVLQYIDSEEYFAGGNRFMFSPVVIPIDELLRQRGKHDVTELTSDEISNYALVSLSKDVLGELGEVTETQVGDRTDISIRMSAGGKTVVISSLDNGDEYDKAIELMAQSLKPFPSLPMHESGSNLDDIQDIVYSSAVTRMKFGPESAHHLNILSSVYNLDYLQEHELGAEYSTRDGAARTLAHNSAGYQMASQGIGRHTTVEDIINARIEGINVVNRLYTEMVRAGIVRPYAEPRSSSDIFQEVSRHWSEYIDLIIDDARRVHDAMTPSEIKSLADKSDLQAYNGFWYHEAPWLNYMETVVFIGNTEDYNATNLATSLAIANHFMDGIPIERDSNGEYHIRSLDEERAIAISQRSRRIDLPGQGRRTSPERQREEQLRRLRDRRSELTGVSQALGGIQNVEFYRRNLRRLQSRMITGLTSKHEGNEEIDGELFASTSIGRKRENQEDSVLLLKDDEIPGLKMMLVADGMGGVENGEIASHMITSRIDEWFKGLSREEKERYYANPALAQQALDELIKKTSAEIFQKLRGGGTTLVCALIGQDQTLISNVGDSRGYAVKDGVLSQITIDDSVVEEEFEKGRIPTREAMRFHTRSNEITQCLGGSYTPDVHSGIMSNDSYDMIIIASDGVTDCLSDEQIAVITRNTDDSCVAKQLVKTALEHRSIRPRYLDGDRQYYDSISGGKDNTTAAVFVKKDRDDDER